MPLLPIEIYMGTNKRKGEIPDDGGAISVNFRVVPQSDGTLEAVASLKVGSEAREYVFSKTEANIKPHPTIPGQYVIASLFSIELGQTEVRINCAYAYSTTYP